MAQLAQKNKPNGAYSVSNNRETADKISINQIRVIGYWITESGVKASFHLPAPENSSDDLGSYGDFNVDFSFSDLPPPDKNAEGKPYYKYTQLVAAFVRLMRARLLTTPNTQPTAA
jgi:hypothetical protein